LSLRHRLRGDALLPLSPARLIVSDPYQLLSSRAAAELLRNEPRPGARTLRPLLVAVGVLGVVMVLAALLGDGNVGVVVAPLLVVALVYSAFRLPLRVTLLG